jgi:hypothetical protein
LHTSLRQQYCTVCRTRASEKVLKIFTIGYNFNIFCYIQIQVIFQNTGVDPITGKSIIENEIPVADVVLALDKFGVRPGFAPPGGLGGMGAQATC